jgi:hypothetical protein
VSDEELRLKVHATFDVLQTMIAENPERTQEICLLMCVESLLFAECLGVDAAKVLDFVRKERAANLS